ncbi:hypothetical protein [Escherichia coli]|uniref:hypothetical protein n=1 Tax=Escherichia coli TaxID=562 RepID=UPI0002D7AF63|nr:hypothetical protein [Escherichia coli]
MRSVIVAFLFACSFCVSAETVNLNNSSVRSFVQWYSSKTGKPVIVNPDIKGNVTVFNADVNPTNIDDFFKSVLNANGFVMLSGNPAVVSLPSNYLHRWFRIPMILITSLMILFLLSHLTSQYLWRLRSEILS